MTGVTLQPESNQRNSTVAVGRAMDKNEVRAKPVVGSTRQRGGAAAPQGYGGSG
jgi:hypothetical protein